MIKMTEFDAFLAFRRKEFEKLNFLPQIEDIHVTFIAEVDGTSGGERHGLMFKYQSMMKEMLREAGALYIPEEDTPMNKKQQNAFRNFRKGDLSELGFIPNIEELRYNFKLAVDGTCCKTRHQVVAKHREIFVKAFRKANR